MQAWPGRCTKLTRLSPRSVDRRVLGEGGFSLPHVLIIMPCIQNIIAINVIKIISAGLIVELRPKASI